MAAADEASAAVDDGHGHNDENIPEPMATAPGNGHDIEKPNSDANGDAVPESEPKRTVTGLKVKCSHHVFPPEICLGGTLTVSKVVPCHHVLNVHCK